MRFPLPIYNPVKECNCSMQQNEKEVSAHILAYQVANQLLRKHSGTMAMDADTLVISLNSLEEPIRINLRSSELSYQAKSISVEELYTSGMRLSQIVTEINDYLGLQEEDTTSDSDIYELLTKLVEIYHARCGLQIITLDNFEGKVTWELRLSEQGPSGWIYSDGTAKNRYGEIIELKEWKNLRPEKIAAYVFGFNRYCSNYPSPLKKAVSH